MFDPPAHSDQNRYLALDGLRGVAALSVMIHHFISYRGTTVFNDAGAAVDLFFILSGFVITHSYGARLQNGMSVFEYMCRRVIRLYPTFILGLVIGGPILYVLMKAGLADYSKRDILDGIIHNGLFLPYFADKGIQSLGAHSPVFGEVFPANPPAWSLFFELVASFAFVALLKMERNILKRTIVISYIVYVLGGLLFAYVDHRRDVDLGQGWGTSNFLLGFPRVFFGFTFGVFLYRFANNGSWIRASNFFGKHFRSPCLLYFTLVAILAVPTELRGLYPALVLAVVAPSLVFIGAAIDCNNLFDRTIARFLGWISYPVYCLHFPIGRAVFFVANDRHYSWTEAALVSIVATIAVAVVLTVFYDEPTRAFLTRKVLTRWNLRKAAIVRIVSAPNASAHQTVERPLYS
jgi:peptidoglycan/LPS O-acetylase OafA/YrhL